GTVQYEWVPMVGSGIFQPFNGPSFPFQSFDGSLIINYDPDNILNDTAVGFVGDQISLGFGAGGGGGNGILSIGLSGHNLVLAGVGNFSQISVSLTGAPGPLTPGGLPETLDGFLGHLANVSGGSHSPAVGGYF